MIVHQESTPPVIEAVVDTQKDQVTSPVTELSKQIDNKLEKKHRGGFNTNPENINRNGRPKKGMALAEVLRERLEDPAGDETPRTKKELVVEKVLDAALNGNEAFMKLVWNYVDGMPKGNDMTAVSVKDGDKEFKFLVKRDNADN